MLWKRSDKEEYLPTPATYSADIEDTDKDSYSSVIDGSLIDNPIAVGLLKLAMAWDFNTEAEAEKLIETTYINPLVLDVKIPVVTGGYLEKAKFRVSKRKVEMIKTELGTGTAETKWKVSFNLMQKELTDEQKAKVEEVNT